MSRKTGFVFMHDEFAGIIEETETGYRFTYDPDYVSKSGSIAISCTIPLRKKPYESPVMFPFFDGLIPEGWLLDIAWKSWKINSKDRMELLLACCSEVIGAVSVRREKQ